MIKFYNFRQNNSGGHFEHDSFSGIGYVVCVQADSEEQAIARAESIGLYWDGCDKGLDCDCCGDRWYSGYPDAHDEPTLGGKPLAGGWGIPSYIHYLDGTVEPRECERF
jgi:hypothetical protein